jgi:hypothetical protein
VDDPLSLRRYLVQMKTRNNVQSFKYKPCLRLSNLALVT